MNKLEIYKEFYYKEQEKKDQLEDSLNIPLTLVSALITLWFYFFTSYGLESYNWRIIDWHTIIFLISMIATFIFIVLGTRFLLKSYIHNYQYQYIPSPNDTDKYYNELVASYVQNKHSSPNEQTDRDIESYLTDIYRETSSNNFMHNKTKATQLYKCKRFLYYSITCLFITSILFAYNYLTKKEMDKIYKIEITNQK